MCGFIRWWVEGKVVKVIKTLLSAFVGNKAGLAPKAQKKKRKKKREN